MSDARESERASIPTLLAWSRLAELESAPGPTNTPRAEEVHVWVVEPAAHFAALSRERATLSAEEEARATRFRFERHAATFVACRGALRLLLGAYLEADPCELELTADEHGKPFLPGRELEFNVAHTDGLGLVTFARELPVGCDVEALESRVSPDELAPRVLDASEQAELDAVARDQRSVTFLRAWTRKEAFVKALGLGLSLALSSFSVGLARDSASLRVHDDELPQRPWRLHPLELGAGHVGCVCTCGPATLDVRRFA